MDPLELENLGKAIHPTKFRLSVVAVQEEFESIIVMPQNKVQLHKLGITVAIGSSVSLDVKKGDVLLYQVNQMFEASVTHLINETKVLFMHQGDAIGKLTSTKASIDTFTILGDWLLLQDLAIEKVGGLYLPQNSIPPPEFRVLQIGNTVRNDDDPAITGIQVGDEIYVDRSRLGKLNLGSKTFFYMPKGFIHGVKPPSS